MDERAVGAAGDIPKLSSQVGRVTRSPESQNQVSSFGLGHGVLRVRVRLTRRQTCLIPISQRKRRVREELLGLSASEDKAYVKL